ncbi:SAM-dependent methyltransferase [Streptomonospora nanhaiensis]|uniref:SAM-dependent methyltransferase n=1 Tax=Streptomonospora nanhaiensis TaxID=1323731 RepID=A0A853BU88_9ACTN|nr:class I SAM-dependent methyltransferase [Streptomonospora nanhaiensis]NYI98326.1 SAM-dependent methyltransferase [Streptomonospora nanhaiensis]
MSTAHDHTHHHSGPHGPHQPDGDTGLAEILDLDAEVLAEHIASIVSSLPLESEPRHIVDLGCGTGAGTFALLERFPGARVTAVDTAADHLRLVREKAGARVRTVRADLDTAPWPDLGTPDLVWASASLHHLARPDRALADVRGLLAPGGLIAVVELGGFPRFLPADVPEDRPGLEERAHAAVDRHHTEHLPHRGADWGPMLAAAGFTVEDTRTITVEIEDDGGGAVGRYAHAALRRLRGAAAPALGPEDLAALDELLAADSPRGVLRRGDLALRTERTVWAARRP